MKVCSKCGDEKDDAEFHERYDRVGHPRAACKSCNSRDQKQRRKAYTKEDARRWALWTNYRMTPDNFDALLAQQGGACAVCGTDTPGGHGRFHVDHDHVTGGVRGLLCHVCNIMIGCVEARTADGIDMQTVFQRIDKYLSGPQYFQNDAQPEKRRGDTKRTTPRVR